MANCTLECSDSFDERSFRTTAISILQALLDGNASKSNSYLTLCDVNGEDVTVFIRRITVDCDGETVVTDFELDGETPYTATGDVNLCSCTGGLDCSYFSGV